ncbi:hypothetical protein IW262DRAFT_1455019 [Armillaria fumosa]|nr:hypothetical protein IW262DRAFT_1455019 [Armillaria fumosa]
MSASQPPIRSHVLVTQKCKHSQCIPIQNSGVRTATDTTATGSVISDAAAIVPNCKRSDSNLQPRLARQVFYGDLTATEVAAVVDSGSEEGSDVEQAQTQARAHVHIAAHIDEDGSDDGSSTHNKFINDIADEFSGQSSFEDANEFYDCENVDAVGHDMPGSPELFQLVDSPVMATPAVQGHSDVPDNMTCSILKSRSKRHFCKMVMLLSWYMKMIIMTLLLLLQPSLMPEQLTQYAIDIACAVTSQSAVSLLPAMVYLEDLDGPPIPSQAAGACAQNSKKKAMPASLSQIPVHTSLGSMLSSDGVVPVSVKTMGILTSRDASVAAKSKASSLTMSPTISVNDPSLPSAVGDMPSSAVVASVGSSSKQPDPVFLASVRA